VITPPNSQGLDVIYLPLFFFKGLDDLFKLIKVFIRKGNFSATVLFVRDYYLRINGIAKRVF
jgi:hypothetical protein